MTRRTLAPKDPAEILVVTWDYTAALDVGETIVSAVTTADAFAGSSSNPVALWGSPLIATPEVRQTISGGSDGSSYILRCVATLSSGRILVLAATLPVRTA
jgi:hypothetical protein